MPPYAVRLLILYLVGSIVGVGWSVVLAFKDLRNKPKPGIQTVPAPLWVNLFFMVGLMFVVGGVGWRMWSETFSGPLKSYTWLWFIGLISLNVGMWGLLFTTAFKGDGKK